MPTIQSTEWIATARLLRRTGFGTTGAAVDAAMAVGRVTHLKQALASDPASDPGSLATPLPKYPITSGITKKDSTAAQKKQARVDRQSLVTWWLGRMCAATEPLPEKLTLLWHNHFATSLQKVRSPAAMLQQNQTFRSLGRGDFRTLALSMFSDPAMLKWLDAQKNVSGAANENLAREFMELFALGHGDGYTETDVREGARALTGLKIGPNGAVSLDAKRHDSGIKTFLGVTGNLDPTGYCDAVLNAPASAEFVVRRWWGQLVSNTPPTASTLQTIVTAYGPGRDLSAMFPAMLNHPDFVAAQSSFVTTPAEWLVGLVRAIGVPTKNGQSVDAMAKSLQLLGLLPFYPPSVGGWPSGQAWLSTAAADGRFAVALDLGKAADLTSLTGASPAALLDKVAYQLGIGSWSNRSYSALQSVGADPATVLAAAANTPEYLVH